MIVTHDERVAATADRIISMRDGAFVDETRLDRADPAAPGAISSTSPDWWLSDGHRICSSSGSRRATCATTLPKPSLLVVAIAVAAATLTMALALNGVTSQYPVR